MKRCYEKSLVESQIQTAEKLYTSIFYVKQKNSKTYKCLSSSII